MTVGEFITVEPHEIRPFDVIGEGRVVRVIHYAYTENGVSRMEVAPARVVPDVFEDADGQVYCLRGFEWGDWHYEPLPTEPVRVFRGGPFPGDCGREDDGPVCDSCPARAGA